MMYYCKVKFQPIGGKLYSYKSRLEVSPGDGAEVVVMRAGRPTFNKVIVAEVSETVDPKATRYLNKVYRIEEYKDKPEALPLSPEVRGHEAGLKDPVAKAVKFAEMYGSSHDDIEDIKSRARFMNEYCTEEYNIDELEIREMLQNTHYPPIKLMFTPPEGVVMMAREGNIERYSSVSGTIRPSNKSPIIVLHHEHIRVSNAKAPYPTSFSADFCLGS